MHIIGDVHGNWPNYFKIIKDLDESIQVGDLGIGFNKDPKEWGVSHRFIRGNHDNPTECAKYPNYLGDYGILPNGIFYVGGAYSIDYKWRQSWNYLHPNNQVWWEDEEIKEEEFPIIIDLYKSTKPVAVISHDCPEFIRERIISKHPSDTRRFINRTCDGLLSTMAEEYSPQVWVFGHYHESFELYIYGTHYIGLAELEICDISKYFEN